VDPPIQRPASRARPELLHNDVEVADVARHPALSDGDDARADVGDVVEDLVEWRRRTWLREAVEEPADDLVVAPLLELRDGGRDGRDGLERLLPTRLVPIPRVIQAANLAPRQVLLAHAIVRRLELHVERARRLGGRRDSLLPAHLRVGERTSRRVVEVDGLSRRRRRRRRRRWRSRLLGLVGGRLGCPLDEPALQLRDVDDHVGDGAEAPVLRLEDGVPVAEHVAEEATLLLGLDAVEPDVELADAVGVKRRVAADLLFVPRRYL